MISHQRQFPAKKRSGFLLFALSLALACFDVHSATAQDVIVENGSSAADETIDQERSQQRSTAFNPFVLTAHRQNYFLPISNTSSINQAVYDEFDPELANGLSDNEVKFQFSVRVLANEHDLMLADDAVYFGFTLEAWWQLYAQQLSSPFRETNYTPEVFYLKPIKEVLGGEVELTFGLRHQSNGQGKGLSRSWNRVVAGATYRRNDFMIGIEPWYRLPEKLKDIPAAAKGDDNPDIEDFMGHGNLLFGWRGSRYELASKIHGNPSTGKGGIDLELSFPLFNRFRGLVQYFNGYGESLIDYDRFQQRIGVGVLLSELF